MAARARRFFIFCFLLITPTALLMYFQQYGSGYYNNPTKRLHSTRNHVEETSELLDAFDKEENLKARMQKVLKTESMNNNRLQQILENLRYLINGIHHNNETSSSLLSNVANSSKFEGVFRNTHPPSKPSSRFRYEQKPACKIPKLDPFAKELRQYLEDMPKHRCRKKDQATLKNGIFRLKRSKIRDVLIRYIRRAKYNDFKVEVSDFLSVLGHQTQLQRLKPGEYEFVFNLRNLVRFHTRAISAFLP